MTRQLNIFHRAAVVSAVVGILFGVLGAVVFWQLDQRGAPLSSYVPYLLGIGIKGVLALSLAAVMAMAARLEDRRQRAIIARREEPQTEPRADSAEEDDLPLAA
ncbi:MAG: hypothetical protein AAGB11_07090 [Pseudomonadota bacterium]